MFSYGSHLYSSDSSNCVFNRQSSIQAVVYNPKHFLCHVIFMCAAFAHSSLVWYEWHNGQSHYNIIGCLWEWSHGSYYLCIHILIRTKFRHPYSQSYHIGGLLIGRGCPGTRSIFISQDLCCGSLVTAFSLNICPKSCNSFGTNSLQCLFF